MRKTLKAIALATLTSISTVTFAELVEQPEYLRYHSTQADNDRFMEFFSEIAKNPAHAVDRVEEWNYTNWPTFNSKTQTGKAVTWAAVWDDVEKFNHVVCRSAHIGNVVIRNAQFPDKYESRFTLCFDKNGNGGFRSMNTPVYNDMKQRGKMDNYKVK